MLCQKNVGQGIVPDAWTIDSPVVWPSQSDSAPGIWKGWLHTFRSCISRLFSLFHKFSSVLEFSWSSPVPASDGKTSGTVSNQSQQTGVRIASGHASCLHDARPVPTWQTRWYAQHTLTLQPLSNSRQGVRISCQQLVHPELLVLCHRDNDFHLVAFREPGLDLSLDATQLENAEEFVRFLELAFVAHVFREIKRGVELGRLVKDVGLPWP